MRAVAVNCSRGVACMGTQNLENPAAFSLEPASLCAARARLLALEIIMFHF
jgi:hypothetical protein